MNFSSLKFSTFFLQLEFPSSNGFSNVFLLTCCFIVPKTEPMGDTVRYVKEGSRVTLHCVISGAIDPPLYVIWYHGTQQIFPENSRHWKTEVTHQDVHSNKLTKSNDENEALALSQQSMFDSRKTVCSTAKCSKHGFFYCYFLL